jgi:hypothetical protein
MHSPKEILAQFDKCAEDFTFPMFDNGYLYHGDARINIYRSQSDWLLILEVLSANNPRTSGFDSFSNCLHLFGSALHRAPGTDNQDFLYAIDNCPDSPLFADEYEWLARAEADAVLIRGQRVALDFSPAHLQFKAITLLEPPQKDPPAILRSLLPEYRHLLLATDAELAARNPHALPLWWRLDEWHHPDLANGERPSQSETFQMIADAIAAGDKSKYRPTMPSNTHWKNWPEGGTL